MPKDLTPQMDTDIPKHVAIIMDGNGRWATQRGLHRTLGHKAGAEALKRTVRAAGELGIQYLTLFGFSCENWSRPAFEVRELMRLLRLYLRAETAELQKNNIRLKVIGDRKALDPDIVKLIENAERISAQNDGIVLMIAINYGGRQDIANSVLNILNDKAAAEKSWTSDTVMDALENGLSTAAMPEPDLLIRTSGEQRISNFLLWQCAYSEFYFTQTYWPDFGKSDLEEAIQAYRSRERRFGGLQEQKAQSVS